MMHKGFLKTGAFLAALAVVFGAFAAHTIKSRVEADALSIFETGARYQIYHAVALILVGILYKDFAHKSLLISGKLFVLGIFIFSGSLYLLTYIKAIHADSFLWVGAITPIGGACFIVGWLLMCRSFFAK